MPIINNFSGKEIIEFGKQIQDLIKNEDNLTSRNQKEINRMLKKSEFYVSLDDSRKILGFIAKEKLVDDYYELKCWYVVKNKRKTGLADELFLKASENPRHKYLAVTFNKKIVLRLDKYGFRVVDLTLLPLKVLYYYLMTRKISSIAKHLFSKKSYLILKA